MSDGNGSGSGTAMVQYQAKAPVKSKSNLKTLLEANQASLRDTLPKHVTPERLMKTMLIAVNRTPDLLQCTQSSIMQTISRAAELGLDLSGTLGEAYPVPFNNKVNGEWQKQCQLIIGYRGLLKLARQSGEVVMAEARLVYENDDFDVDHGRPQPIQHKPKIPGDRGEIILAYAQAWLQGSDRPVVEYMDVDQIEGIRKRSKAGSDRNGNAMGPWKSDWGEMARKTVFRRLAKWLPLSAEKFQQAVEQDNADFELPETTEASTLPTPGRHSLADDPAPAPLPNTSEDDPGPSGAEIEGGDAGFEPPAEPGQYDPERAPEAEAAHAGADGGPLEQDEAGGTPQQQEAAAQEGEAPTIRDLTNSLKTNLGIQFQAANEKLKEIAEKYGVDRPGRLSDQQRREIADDIFQGVYG